MAVEAYLAARIIMAYLTYHAKLHAVNLHLGLSAHLVVPETAKIAAFIFIGVCALKLIMAVANYSHATTRTDRTVENVNGHRSLMLKVTVLTLLASAAAVCCLNAHKGYAVEVAGVVDSFKQSVYFQIALQIAGHYLMNKLHEQESKLPRIVDMKAHATRI